MICKIALVGCDDTTTVEIETTEEEAVFLERIAQKTVEESYIACQPIMRITRKDDSP